MMAALWLAAFVLGAALGTAHFLSLWWSVALIRCGSAGLGVGVQVLRFAALALALVLVARQGPSLYLPAAAGVFVVRLVLTRRYRRLA